MYDIVNKVIDGTRSTSTGILCKTCAHGTIIQGADSKEIRYCGEINATINFDVVRCNDYYPKNLPSINDLYRQAWILETNKKANKIGFVHYKEWGGKNKYGVEGED